MEERPLSWVKASKLEECLAYLTGGSSRGAKGVEAGPMVAAFAIVGDWLAAEVLRQVPA